jgi:hypothetical protein
MSAIGGTSVGFLPRPVFQEERAGVRGGNR